MASKILVVGDVNGQFPTVFEKISALHAKNAFSFALIVGNLFADPLTATAEDESNVQSLIDETITVPLPTYFALGNHPLPKEIIEKLESSNGEVCSHLYFLGKRTTIKTSEGIRIVALGGVLDANIVAGASKDKYPPYYGEDDARILKGANAADILVTTQWPARIREGSKVDFKPLTAEPLAQQCLTDLCSALKPRYHFSISPDIFFEREPFFHTPNEASPESYAITRFISLARFGNPHKQKWIYAFSLDPKAAAPVSIPAGTTASPLPTAGKKRPAQPTQESSYRFSTDERHHRKRPKRQRGAPPGPGECFFCLSNPNVATHLITSIGEDAYLTTAKGPLTTPTTFPKLGFPGHMLIIPLNHSPTLAAMEEESRGNTYREMLRYRHALNSMLKQRAGSELGSITWEVSRNGGVHTHWQYLPIPSDLIRRGLVEAAFKVEAENLKYPPFEKREVGDGLEETSDFFRVMIWALPSEEDGKVVAKSLFLPIDASFRFDLQFGRRVLAKLLRLEKRIDWHDCGQTQVEEEVDAEAFKKAFKEFDFSLEE